MYHFYNYSKNIYVDMADKIDNIVKLGFDKIDKKEFEKYDFAPLLAIKKVEKPVDTMQDYAEFFDIDNKKFDSFLTYTMENFVKKKEGVNIEYEFIFKNMDYLKKHYEEIVENINKSLETFKFSEINSVDQSILLLAFTEYKSYKTPKSVIIKEAMMLADTFSGNSSLINAILDKTLNL